jgi:hypothetical protein
MSDIDISLISFRIKQGEINLCGLKEFYSKHLACKTATKNREENWSKERNKSMLRAQLPEHKRKKKEKNPDTLSLIGRDARTGRNKKGTLDVVMAAMHVE